MLNKSLLLSVIFFFTLSCFSQKSYDFDYVLEYDYSTKPDSAGSPQKQFRFLNSKDNTYMLVVREIKDEVNLRLVTKYKTYSIKMPREDFFVESIVMKCPDTYTNSVNYLSKKDFTILTQPDTLINTYAFKHYVLNPVNAKKIEKYKLLPEHYIIEQAPAFTIPFMQQSDWAYKIWEHYTKIPHGVMKEWYLSDVKGNKKRYMKLVQYIPIKKYIIIDAKCK